MSLKKLPNGLTKAEHFSAKLKSGKLLQLVGAHNGFTAKLVENNGFDAIWASSLEISASYAKPDTDVLSFDQFLNRSNTINDAVSLPVIVDCGNGYVLEKDIQDVVKQYEKIGIAGISIEDQAIKVNSLSDSRQKQRDKLDFAKMLNDASNAKSSDSFKLIARIESFIAGNGLLDAIERANLYSESGADMILIHSKAINSKEIEEFCLAWDKRCPIVIVPTTYYGISKNTISKLGIDVVIYANQIIRGSYTYINQILNNLRESESSLINETLISPLKSIFDLQNEGHANKTD